MTTPHLTPVQALALITILAGEAEYEFTSKSESKNAITFARRIYAIAHTITPECKHADWDAENVRAYDALAAEGELPPRDTHSPTATPV